MKQTIALVLIILSQTISSRAQHSIGPELGINLTGGTSVAIGASYRYTADLKKIKELNILGTAGLYYVLGQGGADGLALINIKGGASYDFTKKIAGAAELGFAFSAGSGGGSTMLFGTGAIFKLTETLDLHPRFEFGTGITLFAVRLGYHF
jgi:hypothetical protein